LRIHKVSLSIPKSKSFNTELCTDLSIGNLVLGINRIYRHHRGFVAPTPVAVKIVDVARI